MLLVPLQACTARSLYALTEVVQPRHCCRETAVGAADVAVVQPSGCAACTWLQVWQQTQASPAAGVL